MRKGMPSVAVKPDAAVIAGGMDVVVSPIFAKPGTARLAYNYEYSVNGGVDRLRGIEPFDGHASPSDAIYTLVQCSATVAGVTLGNTLTGATSGATGTVIYLSGNLIGMTRVAGTFTLEVLNLSGSPVATISSLTPAVDGFTDNALSKLAADEYQTSIAKVPGSGRIRGLAVLNNVVYAWRNNALATAMAIYKSSVTGWTLVPMYHQVSFTAGSSAYAEGATISQGGVTATVKRVVLESGAWSGTAAGRLIITAPSGGVFSAGAAAGGGACTLSGASALITLAPGGVVSTDAYTFTAALSAKRLYGCDGVNPEFEFDGDVWVPLNTGMSSIRATSVRCHKNYVFYGYRGSLQHCAVGNPYVWSAVFGAAELGTGDEITCLLSLGGATDASALMVLCRNALFTLYGDSTLNWNMVPLSRIQGAQARSAQDIGGAVALDTPGVVRYPATKNFGNFAWDTVSMGIQPIAREQNCACSVYVSGLFKYRIFFADGTAISGLPVGAGKFEWSVINYGRNIVLAEHAEIAGVPRTFYADDNGWVYEADKGRSFAGDPIPYAIKLHPLYQRSPMVEKTYRQMQLEIQADGACTIYTSAEFGNGEDGPTEQITTAQYGQGLAYDLTSYDRSYWDSAATGRKTMPCEGYGTNIALTVAGQAADELTHTIYAVTVNYTPRRITR